MLTRAHKKIRFTRILLFVIMVSPLFQACNVINPNKMLVAEKGYVPNEFLNTTSQDFIIAQGDILKILVFTKNGYTLIEPQIATQVNGSTPQSNLVPLDYVIDVNGEANLPLIGKIKLEGKTAREAEFLLAQKYAANYIDPFVNIQILNKYITVFRGGSDAKQIPITRPDMTVVEAIGAAGGIPENGKSSKITVIRMINGQPQTELIDLSSLENLAKANTYVMPNDVIYVEPAFNGSIIREISPIVTAISSIVLIYVSLVNLNR